MAGKSPAFDKAVTDSRKLKAKPTDDELLEGTQAKFEDAEKPGSFDFKGKYKYNAWKKVHEEGITVEEAQKKYVELVEKLKSTLGFEG
ncbi:hypothetical protein MMC08_007554 [Hypocenomyce scalaris]|nr:hypothetical protein [Hypocenomyce scalaris]